HTKNKSPGCLDEVKTDQSVHVWYRWAPNPWRRLLHFGLSQILMFFSMLRYWRKDVIIYANTILPAGAALAGWLMRKPVVYHVHEIGFQPAAFTHLLLGVMKLTASKLIYVSHYLADVHQRKGEVIHNALTDDFFNRPEEKQHAKNARLQILMICSLKKEKGIFDFIQLARSMSGMDFHLLIGSSQTDIDLFLAGENIPGNLAVYPAHNDVHPFYQKADVLLNLSHPDGWIETFGLTIAEAQAYGLPAIVPPIGGPLEVISEGEDGFAMDVADFAQIQAKLSLLDQNREQLNLMAQKARQNAVRWKMDRFQAAIQNSMQKLLNT
ncbi:MAG: glycosyltransferase family 4 protein, partial [Bacteroidota bacterium]